MNKLLVYKSTLLRYSETFIKEQVAACSRWTPVLAGLCRVPGLSLEGIDVRLLARGHGSRTAALATKLWRETGLPLPGVLRRMRREDARLVHVHFGTEVVAMWPALRRLGLPVLVTLHGSDINIHREWWERPAAGWASRRYPRRLLQIGMQDQVHFIAVSEAIRSQAIAYGLSADKVSVRYIGIDRQRFQPGGKPIEDRSPRILYVGRMVEKKGCEYLIDAFATLHAQIPDAELVMVGDGPLLDALRRRANTLAVPVQFRGSLPSDAVRRELEQARVFCLPSVTAANGDAEGLGLVILEAQACGVPVVTSARGGASEGIVHASTGFAVPERDVAALAHALRRVLAEPGVAQAMSIAAPLWIKRRFDLHDCTAALETEYDRLAAAPMASTRRLGLARRWTHRPRCDHTL